MVVVMVVALVAHLAAEDSEEEVGSVDLEVGEDMKTMNRGVCKELAAGLAAAVGSVEGSAEGLAVVLVEDLVEE